MKQKVLDQYLHLTQQHTMKLRQKNKAHRRAKRSNSPGDWANFRRERNHYTEKIREAATMNRTKLASKLNEGVSSGPKSW